MEPLKCPLCGGEATKEHFIEFRRCRDAAASIGGIAASLMRTSIPGNRSGGRSTVTYRHRDQMAASRQESTLKVPISRSILIMLGIDPAEQTTGEARNVLLGKLGFEPMGVRGSNKINQRYPGSRVQLDFRREDVVDLWNRFSLGSRDQSLGRLTKAIEEWVTHSIAGGRH